MSYIIESNDIPQADSLEDVINSVQAVNQGKTTYQDIADFIGKVERQGRYYRRAAEILGLLTKTQQNFSSVTDKGLYLIEADELERYKILAQVVLDVKVFQRIIVTTQV